MSGKVRERVIRSGNPFLLMNVSHESVLVLTQFCWFCRKISKTIMKILMNRLEIKLCYDAAICCCKNIDKNNFFFDLKTKTSFCLTIRSERSAAMKDLSRRVKSEGIGNLRIPFQWLMQIRLNFGDESRIWTNIFPIDDGINQVFIDMPFSK